MYHVADGILRVLHQIGTMRCRDVVAHGIEFAHRAAAAQLHLGQVRAFEQLEAHRHDHWRFYASHADFALPLRRVAVASGEQRAIDQNRQPDGRADGHIADIQIAAIRPWRKGAEAPRFLGRHAQHAGMRLIGQTDMVDLRRPNRLAIDAPLMKVGVVKIFRQQAHARAMRRPAPAFVPQIEDVNLQRIAGLRPFDPDRAVQRMNPAPVDLVIFSHGPAWLDLPVGFLAVEDDHIAAVDFQARLDGIVPKRLNDTVV